MELRSILNATLLTLQLCALGHLGLRSRCVERPPDGDAQRDIYHLVVCSKACDGF